MSFREKGPSVGAVALSYELEVNGFSYPASFSAGCVNTVLMRLLRRWENLRRAARPCEDAKGERPLVVFLCAPPGAGKSTLGQFLVRLAGDVGCCEGLQCLGMDGFHHAQAYLSSHAVTMPQGMGPVCLAAIKGAPESFDLAGLTGALRRLRAGSREPWPRYDRRIHDVVADAVPIVGDVVLVEGNWLLLDEPGWCDLRLLCDDAVFLRASEEQLRDRLVRRKVKGGLAPAEALAHYRRVDGPNVRRILDAHGEADVTLDLVGEGDVRWVLP